MLRVYLKLARSFNAVLTGISPVMGAVAMNQYDISLLFLLFMVGFFGHTFGFVFNDIIDYKIDKSSKELRDRPLISGTISLRKAWIFAFLSMIIAILISFLIAYITGYYFPLLILIISAFFIALYDLISKRFPFMDFLVALGILFLVLYGALYGYRSGMPVSSINDITFIAWIVCILGSTQVLFMQIVAGGMKDIENDYLKGARTTAISMGVRIVNSTLKVSKSFKILAYFIQLVDIILVFLPFFIIKNFSKSLTLKYFQWFALIIIAFMMFILLYKLLSMDKFDRKKARRFIGTHYMTNFALVPIMLMSLNPCAGLIAFFPALGFIFSNIILHGTLLQPKTM